MDRRQQQNFGLENNFSRMDITTPANSALNEATTTQGFEQISLNFRKKMFELNSKLARIFNYNELLKNPETPETSLSIIERKGKRKGLLEFYHKGWIALRLAFGLYGKLEESPEAFYSSRQEFITNITEFYPELGKKIELFTLPKQNEILIVLSPVIKVINNPQLVASHIATHYDELMQKIDRMKDQKAANKLRRPITALSGRELKELTRCINDVRSWPYRGAYGISLFIERGFLYINGGRSRYDKEGFLGFNMNFRDDELVMELRSSPEVRKLMTYSEELKFFSDARYAIKKSVETEGNWAGFEEFYHNLEAPTPFHPKRKNYIGIVREKYGNEEFARLLEAFKEKKHEAPVDWEYELGMLSERLTKQAYQLVIEPAANALLRIFNAAIKRLEGEEKTAIGDLKRLMTESNEMAKIKRQFLKILGRTRKQLIKELERERIIFGSLMKPILFRMPKVDSKLKTALNVNDSIVLAAGMRDIFGRFIHWGNFNLAHLRLLQQPEGRLESDDVVRALTAAIGSFEREAVLASQGIDVQDEIDEIERIKFSTLAQANKTMKDEIIPNLAKCEAYLNSRLGFYTDKVEYYLRGNIQPQSKQALRES